MYHNIWTFKCCLVWDDESTQHDLNLFRNISFQGQHNTGLHWSVWLKIQKWLNSMNVSRKNTVSLYALMIKIKLSCLNQGLKKTSNKNVCDCCSQENECIPLITYIMACWRGPCKCDRFKSTCLYHSLQIRKYNQTLCNLAGTKTFSYKTIDH